jgi:DNA-binding GntR family transcriptional regulator
VATKTTKAKPRRTAAEVVYLALKRDILALRMPPGEPLKEQVLAERFGTSRVPVREACRRLQQEGLVESIPYKGDLAGRISLKELSDCFDLRIVLETHALASALASIGEEGVRRLVTLSAHEYSAADPESWDVFLARNIEFHVALAGLCGNHRLTHILRDLLEGMQRYFRLGLALGDYGAEMRGEHEELADLVGEGRREEAVECLKGQIERSRERILRALVEGRADIPIE